MIHPVPSMIRHPYGNNDLGPCPAHDHACEIASKLRTHTRSEPPKKTPRPIVLHRRLRCNAPPFTASSFRTWIRLWSHPNGGSDDAARTGNFSQGGTVRKIGRLCKTMA